MALISILLQWRKYCLYQKSIYVCLCTKKNFFIFFLDHIPSDLLKEVSPLFVTPLQFSSVAQSCPTLCDPMNRSTPGFPVHHQLPEFTKTHIHRVGDAIQPSHSLLSLSSPALNLFQLDSYFIILLILYLYIFRHCLSRYSLFPPSFQMRGFIVFWNKNLDRISPSTVFQ